MTSVYGRSYGSRASAAASRAVAWRTLACRGRHPSHAAGPAGTDCHDRPATGGGRRAPRGRGRGSGAACSGPGGTGRAITGRAEGGTEAKMLHAEQEPPPRVAGATRPDGRMGEAHGHRGAGRPPPPAAGPLALPTAAGVGAVVAQGALGQCGLGQHEVVPMSGGQP